MIEKMKFVTITGPKRDFDRVVGMYLNKYSIHLENALAELSSVHELKPFIETNPYKDTLAKSEQLVKRLKNKDIQASALMPPDKAGETIEAIGKELEVPEAAIKELIAEREHYTELINQIEPFRNLDFDIKKILDLKFINFRFGRIAREYYNKFIKYVRDNLNSIFYECNSDREYVWGVYFVPTSLSVKVDAVYASMHFERIFLSYEFEGTPEEAYRTCLSARNTLNNSILRLNEQINGLLAERSEELITAHNSLFAYSSNFEVRKLAACTREKDKDEEFYILCGWLPEKDEQNFSEETGKDPDVYCIIEDVRKSVGAKVPTRLKNPRIFKPFEMFVRMYGLPAYNEVDPTSFVAITYSIIFGIMFGDVGQGLCLAIAGYLIYKLKKSSLAAIISVAGVFSTLAGFIYGSVFGFEHIIKPLWMSPMENVLTILLTSVGFGVVLILISMLLNIINSIKEKNLSRLLFDTNGLPGLIFYGAAIACVLLAFTGRPMPAVFILILFFAVPLLLIFFKEPLSHIVEKKAHIFPEHKAMFFLENFFELFEVLLSYVTNTISFLRIGAFALSHAAMMGVVMLLSGAETGSSNIVVIVLGNIIVIAMEGLVAGIQVLRLEYYEMFSRFYKGTGKEFKPYNINKSI